MKTPIKPCLPQDVLCCPQIAANGNGLAWPFIPFPKAGTALEPSRSAPAHGRLPYSLDSALSPWLCPHTAKTKGRDWKQVILAAALVLAASAAQSQTYGTGSNPNSHLVQGYTTSSGTYVQPHQQTNPNGTQRDNYGTTGNVNPYTGSVGTRNPKY
ncbi:MAG: hypothetical protein ACLQDM_27355 [Bradyrhizobium sp.]